MELRLAAIMVTDVVGYSRLIRADEEGTIAALKSLRADLIYPKIDEHHGRVVKLMGDVVIDGDDIQGDGVNVAARLKVMAEPGGICVSDVAYQSTKGKTGLTFDDLGEQRLKNIDTPIRVWRWALGAVGGGPASGVIPTRSGDRAADQVLHRARRGQHRLRRGRRGTAAGQGAELDEPPGIRLAEPGLASPAAWSRGGAFPGPLRPTGQRAFRLGRCGDHVREHGRRPGRGGRCGRAQRFPLIGISQGCSYSIAYATRHLERVSRLILYGGFAKGRLRSGSEIDRQQHEMQTQMIRQGWGRDNPAFRQFFTSLFIPGATKEQMDWFNELQRTTTSPEKPPPRSCPLTPGVREIA